MMTLREAAQYLHCHTSTLYRLANAGMLPAFRLGGGWRCRRSDIDWWIADQHVTPEGRGRAPAQTKRPAVQGRAMMG